MRTRSKYRLTAAAVLAAAVVLGVWLYPRRPEGPPPSAGPRFLATTRPAAAAYHPGREKVLVVSQHGEIAEFDKEGRRGHAAVVGGGRHLEGVTVDSRTGWVYAVDGAEDLIYEIDMDRQPVEIRRTFELAAADVPVFRNRPGRRPGFSGICFLPPQGAERGGRFILSHPTNPPGLVEVELPLLRPATQSARERIPAVFVNWYDFGVDDLSDVAYDAATRTLLVLSSTSQELFWVALDGTLLRSRRLQNRVGMNGLALLPLSDRELFVTMSDGRFQCLLPTEWGDTLPSSERGTAGPTADRSSEAPPKPYYESIRPTIRSIRDDVFPHLHTQSGWRRWRPNGWILFGFGGQFLFFMRFVVQWLASERNRRVTVPVAFWYISIAGSLTILIYAAHRRDVVFLGGQVLACLIYFRNLMLIYRRRREIASRAFGGRAPVDNGTIQDPVLAEPPRT